MKWAIVALLSWGLFFIILFAGVVPSTSLIKEYGCTITNFEVEPRFDCTTRCPIIGGKEKRDLDSEAYEALEAYLTDKTPKRPRPPHPRPRPPQPPKPSEEHCDDLEKGILGDYSPNLCLNSPFGQEDPLCPPDSTPCFSGRKYTRKCRLECPLAYNITVGLDVDHIGHVDNNRDLGTDTDKYNSYKEEYVIGKRTTCQVVRDGEDNVRWVDDRMSHKAFAWWKWSMFSATVLLALASTILSVLYYMNLIHGNGDEQRERLLAEHENLVRGRGRGAAPPHDA